MPHLFTQEFDSLPVIIYLNKATNQFSAFVCENKAARDREVARLRAMDHIDIKAVKDSVVMRAE